MESKNDTDHAGVGSVKNSQRGGPMRVLIAEDDMTSRAMLSALLRKAGHTVVETSNGAEAWEAMQRADAPQLAILDWMMPEMDGLELTRRIREVTAEQPPYILMLTTKSDRKDIIAGLEAGANDYVTKPFDAAELRARIEVGRRLLETQNSLIAKVDELRLAFDHIRTLRGILPICSSCKKIRDDQGYWNQLESYVSSHTEAMFSHSICPACSARLYPEFNDEEECDVEQDAAERKGDHSSP